MKLHSDSPATTDLLNRKTFAERIAKGIVLVNKQQEDSIVIGINGQWGSGKSTLLSMIRSEISQLVENTDKVTHLSYNFNPWVYSGQSDIERSFLEELLILLKLESKKNRKLKQVLSKTLDYLTVLKGIPIASNIADSAEEIKKLIDKEASLAIIKDKVNSALVQSKIKLCIFIDDLDRLSLSEVEEIFRVVKLNANFKNTIFIIAYDRSVIEDALKRSYGEYGSKYLDKIIQVDFKVPEILPEKIKTIFLDKIDSLFKNNNYSFEEVDLDDDWNRLGLNNIFRNLRDVNRYMNAIFFSLPMIYGEVNTKDFLLLEVIRVFGISDYEKVYQFILSNKNVRYMQNTLSHPEYSKAFLHILLYLFPTDTTYRFELLNSKNNEKRLADHLYSERFFALEVGREMLSDQEFRGFIEANGKVNYLSTIAKGGRMDGFLNRLRRLDYVDSMTEVDWVNMFDSFLTFMTAYDVTVEWGVKFYETVRIILNDFNTLDVKSKTWINQLEMNSGYLCWSKMLFVIWTFEDYNRVYTSNTDIFIANELANAMTRLEKVKNELVKSRVTYILHRNNFPHISYVLVDILPAIAQQDQVLYIRLMSDVLSERLIILDFLKYLVKCDDKRTPVRFDQKTFNNIFPDPLKENFIHQIKKLANSDINHEDKLLIKFIQDTLDE